MRLDAHPVILGTGLTGLAISRALSSAGIRHVLVGDPPSETPRLGESLNLEGSLEMMRQFPEFSRFLSDKRRQALFFGDVSVSSDFIQYAAAPEYYRLMDYPPTIRLFHLDRIGFDRHLYDSAVSSDRCIHLEGPAVTLDYDAATDRIRSVELASGKRVESTYVFDATNHACFVARRIGVRRKVIGEPQRVVFAHYRAAGRKDPTPPPWLDATSLLRLDSRTDSVDGLAWCIPLRSYVSVGISVDPKQTVARPGLLLDWLDRAWSRRGVRVRAEFPVCTAPVDIHYEHYNHERCYGRNWLLAGTSCCQFWFPSASGVATGLIAARFSADILMSPSLAAPMYQAYIDQVAASHSGLDWLTADDPSSISLDDVRRRAEAIAKGNVRRLAGYLDMQSIPGELVFGDALLRMFESSRRMANPLRFDTAPPQAQATRLFADLPGDDPWMDVPIEVRAVQPHKLEGPRAILGLVEILSGRRSVETAKKLVTTDVNVQIDQFQVNGLEQFQAWMEWLLGSPRVKSIELVPASLERNDTRWVLTAQWQGTIGSERFVSPKFDIQFDMARERVSAIYTRRADHTFVTGDSILPSVAFAAVLAELTSAAGS